jgi:hypothetical protein
MINVVLSANPCKKEFTGGVAFYSTTFNLTSEGEAFPKRVVQISTAKEAAAIFAAYIEEIRATGKGAAVTAYKHSRCPGRKPPGFDAATKTVYVNV